MEARYLTDLEWRICHAVNIYVFRNGRDGEQPVLVHIPPAKKKNMRTVMNVVQERVKYPVGYAKYLFKMDGTRVKDPCELEMYNNYVVASNFEKHFKCAAYGRKRSPLLVLNRESKHVRVLKLQNQNYYEWLLKKKAVGEERPPYIYPPYYTNENKLPQDLPMGKMGNYNPGEVHAPGCCYPSTGTDGSKTYRIDANKKYVVNTVTVDVNPDFRSLPLPDFKDKRNSKYGYGGASNKYGGKNGKMLEPTPSDMINANVLISDGASPELVTVTSESDDHMRMPRKHKGSKNQHHHQKSKSNRAHMESSEEYHRHHLNRQQQHIQERSIMVVAETTTATTQSSQEVMKNQRHHHHHHGHHASQNKVHSKHKQGKVRQKITGQQQQVQAPQQTFLELGVPPPPPAQFRDNNGDLNNNQNGAMAMQMLQPPAQYKPQEAGNILNYVDNDMNEQNVTNLAPQKSFYYSPEKLAEINPSGNIQPLELTFSTNSGPPPHTLQPLTQTNVSPSSHPATTQWAIVPQPQTQQQQQQFVQQVYAIESQPGGPGTPTTTTLIPAPAFDANGMMGAYTMAQQQNPCASPHQIMQSLTVPQQGGGGVLQSLSSQQAFMQSSPNQGPASQCIVIPNNCVSPAPPPGTQLIALPNSPSQNHLQQVYQLGIVQQPNPQTCIQVDAKAMRQYVDNQKLIECRFQQQYQQRLGSPGEDRNNNNKCLHRRKQQRQLRKCSDVTDVTETEVDIPYTPLKTYRLENPPNVTQSRSSIGQKERSGNPSRYRNERLPKVKSRNVAIQMGYPASGRSNRNVLDSLFQNVSGRVGGGGDSEISLIRNNNVNNRSRSDSMANATNLGPSFSSLMRTPRTDRERFFLQNNSSTGTSGAGRTLRRAGNFCSSYSDQYLGRVAYNNSQFSPDSPYGASARRRFPSDPVLEELITIPPPTEFRGYPLHSTNHQRHHQLNNSNARSSDNNFKVLINTNTNNPSEHSKYSYASNNDQSKYMYSRYP